MPKSPHKHNTSGFTIVELLIVIVVIAILAAITTLAYNGIQQRARDVKRRQDVASIANALNLWSIDTGKNVEETGGGYQGRGRGWYSHVGGVNYTHSIEEKLLESGIISGKLHDDMQSYKQGGYMVYICPQYHAYSVLTQLEKPSDNDLATMGEWASACHAGTSEQDPDYTPISDLQAIGMNYAYIFYQNT